MIAIETVKNITDCIVHNYQPDMIIIFGSYAKGNHDENSDLDILVVSDNEKDLPRYKRGLETRLAIPDFDIPKDILFYSHEEIEKWRNVPLSFVHTVLSEGQIVYEKH